MGVFFRGEQINIRLPDDPGPNPYDSSVDPKDHPPKDWQIAGRGWSWWISIISMGVGFYFLKEWLG